MALISAVWSAPGYTQQNGRTRLIGSSFGVLGINATFDYVVRRCLLKGIALLKILLMPFKIIGGGTSGLTVGNRLAANPAVSVAVIEGGSFYEIDNGNVSQVPGFDAEYSSSSPTTIQPLVDWGIVTVPQAVRIPFQKDSTASTFVVRPFLNPFFTATRWARNTLHPRQMSWRKVSMTPACHDAS